MKKFLFLPVFPILLSMPALLSFGCNKPAILRAENQIVPTPAVVADKKYLALGDSYTIGQGVAADQRFPAQMVANLRQGNMKINDPEYIATTGWTTQNLINAIAQQNPQEPYDVVTLLIGVNDQYQRLDTGGYRIRFTQLLNKSIELAGNMSSHVFVVSIPDYGATPFVPASDKPRVKAEIDQFNLINYQVTLQKNISYLDITPSTREVINDPSLVASDGLHPSGKEYKKWADRLALMIKTVLQ